MKKAIFVLLAFAITAGASAQTRVVYGKITAFNQYPLQNIEVRTKKSKAAVRTDSLGSFSIVCMEKDVIRVRPKAFKSVTRKVDEDTDSLRLNLVFIDTKSNRALVTDPVNSISTGYGYIQAKDLNFAVNHLQQENNEFCNYENIFELIRGRFPGVTVDRTQHSGAVYVRGVTSINLSSEALYVVDGGITSNIDWIHPCDVRSIDVLKDGMTAIYGSRGANGVVVIETRKSL